ncbi:hypothetical protein HWV62_45140 [Athelia sp. TMB]|nr:hypothetical protein HWV62_4425 [Athelia sp. TMB]KAF7978639.1 hypothetical protein HWV62_45140 [Athelia sp. TMB]
MNARCLGLLVLAASAQCKNIVDLAGQAWTLTGGQGNISVRGAVPSHSHLDLFAAGVIGDPLSGDNDILEAWPSYPMLTVTVGKVNSTKVFEFNTNNISFALTDAIAILSVTAKGGGKTYTHTHRFVAQSLATPAVVANIPNPHITVMHVGNTFTVQSKALAAFVWLEHPAGVSGYFSDNGFWMLPGQRTVIFTVQNDTTSGKWASGVHVSSLWTLTTST